MFRKVMILVAAPALAAAQALTQAGDTIPRRAAVKPDTAFHVISLQEALRLTQQNNVAAVQAQGTLRGAQSALRSARAERYPNLSFSMGQNKGGGQRVGPGNTLIDFASKWSYSSGLNTGVTLYDGGTASAHIRQQEANIASAEVAEITTEFNLALQVKQAYNSILAANEQEAAAYAQLDYAEQQFRTSVAKVSAGAATVSDSLRSLVQVGNAQLSLINARNAKRTASAALTHLVGTAYLVTANPADTSDRTMSLVDSAAVTALALNGPVVRQQESSLNAQLASLRASKASYYPTLGLTLGGTGSGNSPYGIGSADPYAKSWSLGVSVNYNIFNRYIRENSVTQADIAVVNAQAQLRDVKLAAQQNILTQYATLRTAEEQIRIDEINIRANEEDLRVQQQRYNLGAGLLLDLLNTQNALVAARRQLISDRLNYRNARAQIESIIGRDLP
jgi:outer membrane protein